MTTHQPSPTSPRPSAPPARSARGRGRATPLPLVPLLAALALACGPGPGGESPGAVAIGDPAPAFRLAALDAPELGPQDFAGDVVLLEFWATWCIPCHAQADVLERVYPEYRERGFAFLAIDLGEDEETVRRFVAANPFPYPVLLDPDDELSWELGIHALPTLMVIDRANAVSFFHTGVVDEDELRRVLDKAAA